MSVRIVLDQPPEFYTNLDFISGRVILWMNRSESIGNVIVKLEGECRTALTVPLGDRDDYGTSGNLVTENHKILYRVFQVYPDDGASVTFEPGQHQFKFNFKVPLNNICHDPKAMSALMGLGGIGTGFRTMDGTKQLMLQHVRATLPPSLTGFPQEAEVRYYIKVTIQRPGLFKENWRYQTGFKFLPIEPPRPPKTNQEAFARRPFAFRPRASAAQRRSFFGGLSRQPSTPHLDDPNQPPPPSIEMSARVPFPTIITCNEPLPLRLLAKKLSAVSEQIYLVALEIVLIGYTQVRVQTLTHVERAAWVVVSAPSLSIALGNPDDAVETEFEVPNSPWAARRLPNTVAPSFRTCNLARRYELEIKLTLSWGLPTSNSSMSWGGGKTIHPQTIHLPLKISNVEVYSGIKPPAALLESVSYPQPHAVHTPNPNRPPQPPPRPNPNAPRPPQRPPNDPLYPPQLGPGDVIPAYDDAPPSYDEAMADNVSGPDERPAYSGVTAENAPSMMPNEKT